MIKFHLIVSLGYNVMKWLLSICLSYLACVFSTLLILPLVQRWFMGFGFLFFFRKSWIPEGGETAFLRSILLEYFLVQIILQEMSCPFYSLRVSKNGVKGPKTDISGWVRMAASKFYRKSEHLWEPPKPILRDLWLLHGQRLIDRSVRKSDEWPSSLHPLY